MKIRLLLPTLLAASLGAAHAQQATKPEDTEVYEPVPNVITPGKTTGDAPADADGAALTCVRSHLMSGSSDRDFFFLLRVQSTPG